MNLLEIKNMTVIFDYFYFFSLNKYIHIRRFVTLVEKNVCYPA